MTVPEKPIKFENISISVMTAISLLIIISSAFVAYFTAQLTWKDELTGIRDEIKAVELTTNTNTANVAQLEKRLDRFEGKLDKVLEKLGISIYAPLSSAGENDGDI